MTIHDAILQLSEVSPRSFFLVSNQLIYNPQSEGMSSEYTITWFKDNCDDVTEQMIGTDLSVLVLRMFTSMKAPR